MRKSIVLAAALLATSTLAWPALQVLAFTTTGESLDLSQRDFRVFAASFLDPTANDNGFPHANFPGHFGATMAIWKAHSEWGSEPRGGNGIGDGSATNPNLGDGGANFDNTFQGETLDAGGNNGNVHSAQPGLGGATLAFTTTPASDGWKITYNDDLVWDDGPGDPVPGALDLQAVATHEIGHALGLGHSLAAGATMSPFITGSGISGRSIAADDIAGLQAIYGVASASKPRIDSLSGTLAEGSSLIVRGVNFAPFGNDVWFTKDDADGDPLVVSGLVSESGGTHIALLVPSGASPGDVLVRVPGSSGASLSNAFPIDVDGEPGAYVLTGPGLADGTEIPQLDGAGDLTPGAPSTFELVLHLAPPSATGSLLVSAFEADLPFHGGVLDPFPILLAVPVTTNALGAVGLAATIPVGVPADTEVVLQAWWKVSGQYSSTNGLALQIP